MAAPGLSREEIDRLWQCEICKTRYVVPSLARDCEDRCLADDL